MAKSIDLSMLQKLGGPDELSAFCLIYDEIDNEVAKQVTQFIIENSFSAQPPSSLNLLINSPGGSLTDAFAIIDIMSSSTIPIRTIGLGQIASAALMIFLSGVKGQRILTPNTSILSHRFSGGAGASKEHELFAIQKEFDMTSTRMMHHYMKTTGKTEKYIKKWLLPPEDVFLCAEDAILHGLCDRIALIGQL